MKVFWLCILCVFASAAVIHGVAYDEDLNPATVIIKVNTTPAQTVVAKSGEYSFNAPKGFFLLTAGGENSSAQQTIFVQDEGEYNVDLILLPRDVDLGGEELNDITQLMALKELALQEEEKHLPTSLPFIALALIAILIAACVIGWRQARTQTRPSKAQNVKTLPSLLQRQPLSQDQQRVLNELQQSNGRMTQKELRKALNEWSEAKVSMEVTELEEKGVITKIRKGRGNVLRTR